MPNWCLNTLSIRGSNEDLNEFARFVRSDEMVFSFEEIISEPAWRWDTSHGFKICDQKWDFGKGQFLDWCDWRCEVWGTKWDLDNHTSFEQGEDFLCYEFETAWSPPDGIIRELVEVFPNLEIRCRFEEPGCAFYGECGGIGGDYFERAEEMTFCTHPNYWTYPCDECNESYVHDGKSCPHCGYNVNTEEVEATA